MGIFTGFFEKYQKNEEDHFYDMSISRPRGFIADVDNGDDDTSSIDTYSTTATADDLPGTGRALDTYFFQPAGRRVESFAMRITIRHLHPWRITDFMERRLASIGLETARNPLAYSSSSFAVTPFFL